MHFKVLTLYGQRRYPWTTQVVSPWCRINPVYKDSAANHFGRVFITLGQVA